MGNLLSVAEARGKLVSSFSPVALEKISVSLAFDRVLGQDIFATLEMPPFDNSSMDGFAIQAEDVQGASQNSPVVLQVVADIPAGIDPEIIIRSGQAARIVTGAVVPAGADAVVPVEETNLGQLFPGSAAPATISIFRQVSKIANIRPRGQDIQLGDSLLTAGKRLRPQDVGVIAMQGIADVLVYRRPKIGLFSSGDELLQVGESIRPGKIFEANSYTLGALINQNGGELVDLGTCADSEKAVSDLLNRAVESQVDLIISSAGVSMGAFDYVRSVIEQEGILSFWRVKMRPGKPLTFGEFRGIPFIGLPGNPVSAFVGFEVFVKPALNRLAGLISSERPSKTVRLLEPVEPNGRESYLRAVVSQKDGVWFARLTGHQGSGNLLSLVQANALIIIPASEQSLPEGTEVQAWFI